MWVWALNRMGGISLKLKTRVGSKIYTWCQSTQVETSEKIIVRREEQQADFIQWLKFVSGITYP